MSFLGAKSAGERVDNYMLTHQVLPGCNPNSLASNCSFNGTSADWETYRRNWIQDCASDNSGGFLQSKNKTLTKCQAVFDQQTTSVAFAQYANNVQQLDYIKSLLGKDNPIVYLIVILFVGLIIYLLMSKKK